jgi:hypothetical protein
MKAMANPRSGRIRRFAVAAICFVFSASLGCSRQEPVHPAEATGQSLPFHPSADLQSVDARPEAGSEAPPVRTTPFQGESQAGVVPVGALLTVKLRGALSAATAHVGDNFLATVADPLIIDGKMLVDSGTLVSGRVESARMEPDRSTQLGYLRLALNSMDMKGKKLSLETASLFARSPAADGLARSASVRLRKGHRLTFRLTAPLVLNEQYKMASAAPLGQ